MILRKLFYIILLLVQAGNLAAQILDDTTKQVYGPKTTRFVLENDILEDNGRMQIIDTLLDAIHQFNPVNENSNRFQDLGNIGTAMRPVFYNIPRQIGTQIGISPYEAYILNADNIRYYDTKSPFTHAFYIQGTRGDQIIHFTYTRNVNKNWNFGIYYRRMNTYKQFGAIDTRETLSDNIAFVAHTSIQTKDEKYKILFHFSHLNQMLEESGGVSGNAESPNDSIFAYRLSSVRLGRSAESWQTHNNIHLYHQYKPVEEFTLFHIFDYKRQRDTYTDINLAQNQNFYPSDNFVRDSIRVFNFNAKETLEGTVYKLLENKAGIKGKLAKFNYRAYFKSRIFSYHTSRLGDTLRILNADSTIADESIVQSRIVEFENFIGGKLFYQFTDSSRITAEAEYLIGRDYLIQAYWDSKNLRLGIRSVLYSPSLVQRRFISNHFIWENPLKTTLANEVYGGITLKTDKLLFNPFGAYTLINNYIYFDTDSKPSQTSDLVQLLRVGINFNYQFGRFKTVNNIIYTQNLSANLIRIPDLFINSRLYCEDCFIRKLLNTQLGIELHFKSDYLADAYMPVSKQFYLQNDFLVKSYAILDLFMNIRIGNLRGFLKLSHLNQLPNRGYITTPIYPGLQRTFSFGINWMFFN